METIENVEHYILETISSLQGLNDTKTLLDRLLYAARNIVNATAGTIYVCKDGVLEIGSVQNDSLKSIPFESLSLPIDKSSIAGTAIIEGTIINTKDAYNLPQDTNSTFNPAWDNMTGYHSRSILSIPLLTRAHRPLGVIQIINARDKEGNIRSFTKEDEFYIATFAQNATSALESARTLNSFIGAMISMVASRDPRETYPHAQRVSSISCTIYDRYKEAGGITPPGYNNFRDSLSVAAKCHDFGKVGVSDLLLKKVDNAFTREERAIMQGHTVIGAGYFKGLEGEVFEMAATVALRHHERYDGGEKGYPGVGQWSAFTAGDMLVPGRRLKGEEIPLAARIVAIADVFDALVHTRCYKAAWEVDRAFDFILKESGGHFDPQLVAAFMTARQEITFLLKEIP